MTFSPYSLFFILVSLSSFLLFSLFLHLHLSNYSFLIFSTSLFKFFLFVLLFLLFFNYFLSFVISVSFVCHFFLLFFNGSFSLSKFLLDHCISCLSNLSLLLDSFSSLIILILLGLFFSLKLLLLFSIFILFISAGSQGLNFSSSLRLVLVIVHTADLDSSSRTCLGSASSRTLSCRSYLTHLSLLFSLLLFVVIILSRISNVSLKSISWYSRLCHILGGTCSCSSIVSVCWGLSSPFISSGSRLI